MSEMEARESTRSPEKVTPRTITLTPAAIDWVKRIRSKES